MKLCGVIFYKVETEASNKGGLYLTIEDTIASIYEFTENISEADGAFWLQIAQWLHELVELRKEKAMHYAKVARFFNGYYRIKYLKQKEKEQCTTK